MGKIRTNIQISNPRPKVGFCGGNQHNVNVNVNVNVNPSLRFFQSMQAKQAVTFWSTLTILLIK